MKIQELVKEYRLSEDVTLTDGTVKTVSIVVSINNNSVSVKPGPHSKEFCFSTVKVTEDKLLEWEAIMKLMYLSSEVIKKFSLNLEADDSKKEETL